MNLLLDTIFPKRCLGCGRIGQYFCPGCSSIVRTIKLNEAICPICEKPAIDGRTHPGCQGRYTLDGLTSLFRYDGIVRTAIKKIKYRYIRDLISEFVSLFPLTSQNSSLLLGYIDNPKNRFLLQSSNKSKNSKLFNNSDKSQIMLVPVPLYKWRERERGFNQSELMGKLVAQNLEIKMDNSVLTRIKSSTPQADLKKRPERLANIKNVFKVNRSGLDQLSNLSIILFDDVFTTGATLNDAANTLKRSGVKFVWGLTVAR